MVAATSMVSPPSARPSPAFRKILLHIYAHRRDALFASAARVLVSHADADDAVQDAFLAVLEAPPRETNERTLGEALDGALRVACGGRLRERAQTERTRATLQRRGT